MSAQDAAATCRRRELKHYVLLIVAGLQIWGAGSATWLIARQLPTLMRTEMPIHAQAILVVALGFYTAMGLAGILLLRRSPIGRTLTAVVQFPQMVQIQAGRLVVAVSSGANALVVLADEVLGFHISFVGRFTVLAADVQLPTQLAVNVIPLFVAWFCLRIAPYAGVSRDQATDSRTETRW